MQNQLPILIEIASDSLQKIPDFLLKVAPTKQILFVCEQKIWQKYQNFFPKNFCENFSEILGTSEKPGFFEEFLGSQICEKASLHRRRRSRTNLDNDRIIEKDGFSVVPLLIKNPAANHVFLSQIQNSLSKSGAVFILGFGSGTINDLCKFVAAQNQIPYAIIPSAASMNGYLSSSASISINNHKKTLPAKPPIAVFCDLKILTRSPKRLTCAGIGDLMCFYGCWFDWLVSHKLFGTNFDPQPFEMLERKMDFFCKNYHHFKLNDPDFLKILMEILLDSGLGMTIAKGSYPASQSEHLVAHNFAMKYPKKSAKLLHGELVAITTHSCAKLQKKLLRSFEYDFNSVIQSIHRNFSSEAFEIFAKEEFFEKDLLDECKQEYNSKLKLKKNLPKLANSQDSKAKKSIIAFDNRGLRDLKKIYFSANKLRKIFQHFGINYRSAKLGISRSDYQKCLANARFIRNRITCLDLVDFKK